MSTIFVPLPNTPLVADLFDILDKFKAKDVTSVQAVAEILNAMEAQS